MRSGHLDIAYADGDRARYDLFPASSCPERNLPPLHIFLHGGYWRGRDKSDHSFIADGLVPQGISTIVMNYPLCPQTTVPEIVEQVRHGLAVILSRADEHGFDPDAVTLSGHSAGAHLAAMALATLPPGAIRHALLISGVFDPAPVMATSLNEVIGLTGGQLPAITPMLHPPRPGVALDIVVGADEPEGFRRWSRDFTSLCQSRGNPCRHDELAGHNHFSIITTLETPDGDLARRIAFHALDQTKNSGKAMSGDTPAS